MNVGVLRLGFAVFWLAMAGMIYFRNKLAPGAWGQSRNLDLVALLALALAGWNLVRWYVGRRRVAAPLVTSRHRRPLEPRGNEPAGEYNPDFDFTKPQGDRPA